MFCSNLDIDLKMESKKQHVCEKNLHKIVENLSMLPDNKVKSDVNQLPGHKFYTALQRGRFVDHFETKKLSSFVKKYMVRQVICFYELKSKMVMAKGSIYIQIYVKEYLQKRLLPFIQMHACYVLF